MTKVLLVVVGVATALFAGLHVFVTWEHWHQVGPARESVAMPAITAILSASLSIWAIRRAVRSPAGA
jgi:hypothetical protein